MKTMGKQSAGVVLYRLVGGVPQVLLVHPGGPFWRNKDDGAWSIPKGEHEADEEPLTVAQREFREELGAAAPQAPYLSLGEVRQRGGKIVKAFAAEGDFDPAALRSNTFDLEWPPRSGRIASFPEVDRAQWFTLPQARAKMLASQAEFIERLQKALDK